MENFLFSSEKSEKNQEILKFIFCGNPNIRCSKKKSIIFAWNWMEK